MNSTSVTGMLSDMTHEVLGNQYAMTMLFYVAFGAITGAIYYIAIQLYDLFIRTFLISVTIDNNGELFDWVVRWLAEQEQRKSFLSTTSSTLQVYVKKISTLDLWDDSNDGNQESSSIEFLPGPGSHMITYQNKTIWCAKHSSAKVSTVGYDNKPFIKESLTLSAYGRDHTPFTELFADARKLSSVKDNDKTKIYVMHEYGYKWVLASAKEPRTFESVILDTNLSEQIELDAKEFLNSQKWYASVGLPYRRGYLLFGPPGCGKTSFVSALAARLSLSICCLTLSSSELNDQTLNDRLHDAPGNAIVLLEDIDSVFVDRNVADAHQSRVTFSGLLNAIDGVASQEGRLFMMTTNHIEKLDPALLRPGRTDVRCEFKRASKKQITEMFHRFYPKSDFPNMSDKLVNTLVDSIPEYTVPMAALQEHFMRYRDEPDRAVNRYHELLNETRNDNSEFLLTTDATVEATTQQKKENSTTTISNSKKKNKKKQPVKKQQQTDEDQQHNKLEGDELLIWLTRLGFSRYIKKFRENKYYTVSDLKNASVSKMGMEATGDLERFTGMLEGRKDVVADFEYANDGVQKRLFSAQFSRSDPSEVDKLSDQFVKKLAKVQVTLHQIKDHLFQYATDIHAAATNVDNLIDPPQTPLTKEEALKIYNGNQTIRSWIFGDKHLKLFDKKQLTDIVDKLEQEDITTLDDLIELDADSDLKEIAKVEKKGQLFAFKNSIEALKKLQQKTVDNK
jgi:chaperone BCS1